METEDASHSICIIIHNHNSSMKALWWYNTYIHTNIQTILIDFVKHFAVSCPEKSPKISHQPVQKALKNNL
jgi:hypothetical protein